MTTIAPAVRVGALAESRPPCLTWQPTMSAARESNQLPLDLTLGSVDQRADHPHRAARPNPTGVQVTLVRSRWCARQATQLPDARSWSTSLALALVETLHGHRPIAQLNRWVEDDVLAAISLHRRRRRAEPSRVVTPPTLRSVRVQHPAAEVAEVSAHLSVGRRSMAIAFRLEAAGERWLCTAAEFGPRT